ncbi:MAG: hypothetical protein ABSE70_09260 [Candidatus Limnocylindrales bacterium]
MDERHGAAEKPDTSSARRAMTGGHSTRAGRRRSEAVGPSARAWVSSDPPENPAGRAEPTNPDGSSGGVAGHLEDVAEPAANVVEPFVDRIVTPVAGAIGSVIGAVSQAWSVREAGVARRVRRLAREPLANLYELYPEARVASPRELGLRFVPVEEIRGTAVAGATQRGGDFLPLKPFRGDNWEARWGRIREANERLQPLPPVDLIKFDGEYWVVDGHNRVAATLYANGVGLDAMVTELIPLDGQTSERPTQLLSYMGEAGEWRAAARGLRPAMGLRQAEQRAPSGAEIAEQDAAIEEITERYPAVEPVDSETPD